jgi:hypothetical protein
MTKRSDRPPTMHCGGRPTCIVVVDQHALEWSTNMHCGGRPTCIGMVDQHALEWSTNMQRNGRPPCSGMVAHHAAVVIGRRNDEAIRILSGISGLLHFVRNNEIWLSRHPLYINRTHFPSVDERRRCSTPDGVSAKTAIVFR